LLSIGQLAINKIRKIKKGGDDMDLKEAEKLADEFPGWVGSFLGGSARDATQHIRWFIQTLYEKDYEIRKKEGEN